MLRFICKRLKCDRLALDAVFCLALGCDAAEKNQDCEARELGFAFHFLSCCAAVCRLEGT